VKKSPFLLGREAQMSLAVGQRIPPNKKEKHVASRQIKMPSKNSLDKEADEIFSEGKPAESGRYLLQIDKQTKGSYETPEVARSVAPDI
jgi:hypothetical protein